VKAYDITAMGVGGGGKGGAWTSWIFIHDAEKVEGVLIVLFFRCPLSPGNFSADALKYSYAILIIIGFHLSTEMHCFKLLSFCFQINEEQVSSRTNDISSYTYQPYPDDVGMKSKYLNSKT